MIFPVQKILFLPVFVLLIANGTLHQGLASFLVCQDQRTDHQELQDLATQDDAQAQNGLGVMYAQGICLVRNEAKAVQWFLKAALQHNVQAQYNLGVLYVNPNNQMGSYADAVHWFTKAAKRDFAPAQDYLGLMYTDGLGLTKNYVNAIRWYRKAATQGFAPAQNHLGHMFRRGFGIQRNEAHAVRWYRKAVKQNDSQAIQNLKSILPLMSPIQMIPIPVNTLLLSHHQNTFHHLSITIQTLKTYFEGNCSPDDEDHHLINKVLTDLFDSILRLKDESLLRKGCLLPARYNRADFTTSESETLYKRRIIVLALFEGKSLFLSLGKQAVQVTQHLHQSLSLLKSERIHKTIDFYLQFYKSVKQQQKNRRLQPDEFNHPVSTSWSVSISESDIVDSRNKLRSYKSLKRLYDHIERVIIINTFSRNTLFQESNPELFS